MARLEKACETYREQSGSEYMWDEYTHLLNKLKNYEQEIDCPECRLCTIHS